MSHSTRGPRARQIEALRTQFAQADDLPFADVLPAERIDRALRQEKATWRDCVWAPALTLWAFLAQVISPDGAGRAAVARVRAWLVAHGDRPCTPKTDPYGKARQRLPESLFVRLTRATGQALHQQAPAQGLWKGRRVKLVDGTPVSRPDTPANQEAYPQHGAQAPGTGFPIARLVVVFCLACGAVLDAALGRYQGQQAGENALLRTLEGARGPGDVVVADRYFGGYFELALWAQRGVDAVVRLHPRRRTDFRRGQRLGPRDHVVAWAKPKRPAWLDEATYAALPASLAVRALAVCVDRPGFRTQRLVVVTTLVDAGAYTQNDLADLYRARWHAELDLRSLTVTLGMDVLRCQSPGMVRQEVWAHLLTYKRIRSVMARAAQELGCLPRELSFQGALPALAAFGEQRRHAGAASAAALYEWLLLAIASYQVGDRPDRVEPRRRKRRPKHYPPLNRPRAEARAALGAKG